MAAESLWTVKDIANYTKKSVSWVQKRVAPNTPETPKIPRLPQKGHPRFDPVIVKELLGPQSTYGSLKTEEVGNFTFLDPKKTLRRKEKLW